MVQRLRTAAVLPLLALAAGCATSDYQARSAADEVARLSALGFRTTYQSSDDRVRVMTYSGPINAAVHCAAPSGAYRAQAARTRTPDGAVQDYRLDAYLQLRAGADGVLSPSERDGIYVVSRTTRPSAGARATDIEGITFESGRRGTFASGLSCRPT